MIARPSAAASRGRWTRFAAERYADRLAGAFFGRAAGCTLGVPVEGWSIEAMRAWADGHGDAFPPEAYWTAVTDPDGLHYGASPRTRYTRDGMDGIPVDDDLAYTQLGLLVAEERGLGFSTADVGRAWLRHLPVACTAEEVALRNLRAGLPASRATEGGEAFVEWIGADIRCDPWGWLAPGRPRAAALMARRDARLSHRGAGVHGAMLFGAAIAAAFAVDDPLEAVRIGLGEIPASCAVARAVRWALETAPSLPDVEAARRAVDLRFPGMHPVHTVNNACLTVFGLALGRGDFTRTIGTTVAMGLDNDCTAATAGSLFGAAHGLAAIPRSWRARFGNRMDTYLTGVPPFAVDDLLRRFAALAEQGFEAPRR